MKRFSLRLITFSLMLLPLSAAEFRQWKDTKGQVIEAKLLKVNGDGTIRIERKDGWVGNVPLELLSEEDRTYAKTAKTDEPAAEGKAPEPTLSNHFEIIRVRYDYNPGYIQTNTGWGYKAKCVKVDLRYTGPGAEVGAHVKAYFYNREGKEIERFSKPPRRQDETKKYINALEKLEPGEKYEAFFPVSEALEKRDLKTVLITFGNQKETAALTDPKADLIAFNFDEKKLIFPGLNAGAKETKGAVDSPAKADHDSSIIIPGMRSVKQDKHPFFVQVNNSWKDEMVCLMTEVQVKGGLPSKVSVSAYFFSGTKKLVATLEKPTMAHFGKKVYSQIPAFAEKNQWYPVLFALDTELEKLRWEWAVIVFIADGRATAKVFGKLDVSITDFTFPGKDQLIKEKEENEE